MLLKKELGRVAARVTVQDGVYHQLRHALTIGRFDPGQSLTIAALADVFGTSHMPVREALRRLAAENALEIGQNGSARVPSVSLVRLDDLWRARIMLEGEATELAAGRMKAVDIDALEAIVHAHEASARNARVYEMLEKNREFHMAIYRASGSEVMLQLIDTLWVRSGPYMRQLSAEVEPRMKRGHHEPYTERHHAIIRALRNHDVTGARCEMIADITETQTLLHTLGQTTAPQQ